MRYKKSVWWLNPSSFVFGFTLPLCIVSIVGLSLVDRSPTIRLQYYSPLYLSITDGAVCIAVVTLVAIGSAFGVRFGRGIRVGGVALDARDEIGLDVLFYIATTAYLIWFGPLFLHNPGLFISIAQGARGATDIVRNEALTVPGITTLTQFGVSYICIYSAKTFRGERKISKKYHFFAACVFFLSLFRALAWGERIAFIELIVPFAANYFVDSYERRGKILRFVAQTAPYLGALALPVLFAIFEYNRSWINFYSKVYDSLPQFTFDRLEIYYISAINNGAGFWHSLTGPTLTGYYTFQWLYKMPFIGPILNDIVGAQNNSDYTAFLSRAASPEFNNQTGIFPIIDDWGYIGACIYFAVFGLFVGVAFNAFRLGRGLLQYAYPILLYSLFELIRVNYINDQRAFTAFAGIILYSFISYRLSAVARKDKLRANSKLFRQIGPVL